MSDITSRIVQHSLEADYLNLSAAARKAVKTYLLDTLGVGIAGAGAPLTQNVRVAAEKWSLGQNGSSYIWGKGGGAVSPAHAAFMNGFQIHCQEYDCVHEPAVVHPLATILSALMADVDSAQRPVSGKKLATALAVSVDLAAGLGVSVKSPIKFFRPANAGIFGATLGISHLRAFNAQTVKDALGYALAFCSGTMQAHVEGKPALPVQIANAARGAIMACDLAEAGMQGPHQSLEGPFGYFSLFEDESDADIMMQSLGKTWRIAEVSHKPFPTGRACQGGIVLMQKLLAEGVAPEAIVNLTLTAPPLIHRLVGRPIETNLTANYARLCFQYCGATALLNGSVGLADFSSAALAREDVLNLGKKISVLDDGSDDPAAFVPQVAEAMLANEKTVSVRIDSLYGSPEDPMAHEAHLKKFRNCVDFGMGRPSASLSNRLIALTDNLETLENAAVLSQVAAGLEA